MMFNPDKREWLMDSSEEWSLKHWLRTGDVTSDDIRRDIMASFGGANFVRMVKVTKKVNARFEAYYKTERDYLPSAQRDEMVQDLFDISLTHRIVMVKYPWDIYLMECDAEHPDTNIDLDMIEAIVGKGD